MTTITEKNLNTLNKAMELPKATKAGLMQARSMECSPRFISDNRWKVQSTTRTNVFYSIEVYFAGYNDSFSHGLDLFIECGCPAGRVEKPCKHVIAIQNAYENNWLYIFGLFGLNADDSNFAELYEKIEVTDARLKANTRRMAA